MYVVPVTHLGLSLVEWLEAVLSSDGVHIPEQTGFLVFLDEFRQSLVVGLSGTR